MRCLILFFSVACCAFAGWGQGVLINELQPACQRSLSTPEGDHPDWVELIGTGPRTVDLNGHTLSLGARHHRFTSTLTLAPKQHLLLFFDGHPERGVTHVDLKLAREGGTLLLIAPDGGTVIDLYSWPSLPVDVSIGRLPDGARSWSFFPTPSPGEPNIRSSALTLVAAPVVLVSEEGRIKVNPPTKDPIRITTDGSPVNSSSPLLTDELWIGPGHVVRARSMPSNALSGPEAMITVQAGAPEPTYLSIAADPRALYNDTIGILAEGGAANFSRSGNEWQAPVLVEQNFGDTSVVSSLGLAVAGSGSRSLAKRSFKLFARDRFGSGGPIELPGSGAWYELFLRADATPHSFLRNMLVEQIVVLAGGHVDVQRSQPVPVYLNGVYQGLYRAMPPKNGAWLMDRSGAEAIDLVDGPGNHALRGSEDGLSRAIEALNRNAPIDSLAKWLDLQSLVDLASLDLYTGRADHDLNVRSWRSRTLEGRWRWIVFDMDLWAPMTENSLERMCSATALEAPYIPLLMGHPDLGPQLMARLEGLLATVLSPAYATELLDSLYNMHKTALERDHDRWAPELDQPTPQSTWEALRAHIQQRPNALMSHFGRYTGRSLRTVRLVRPDPKQGKLFIEDLAMTTPIATPQLLAGIPLRVSALASPGWEFAGWEGLKGGSPVRSIDPSAVRTIRPLFRKTAFRP